ncbi:hypothetical protein BH18ACT4_BH18ACT4_00410 [soil metagenome]
MSAPVPRLVRRLAVVCALVLVVAVQAAWLQSRPPVTRDDARGFAREALEAAGFRSVQVAAAVAPGRDEPPPSATDAETIDVWVTASTVEAGTIVLWVDQSEAQATRAFGTGGDGAPIITCEQYEVLDDYTRDPALARRLRRNVTATVAGVIGLLVALRIAGSRNRTDSAPGPAVAETPATPPAPLPATSR